MKVALEYKKIEYDYISVDLIEGDQRKTEYKKINPMSQVPALLVNGVTITQSMAILEFLEEFYLEKPKLMPTDPVKRGKVREICEVKFL